MYKKYYEGIKAICFDLDGTIVDTEVYSVQAFTNILANVNKDVLIGEVYGRPGEPMEDKWQRVKDKGLMPAEFKIKQLVKDTHEEYLKVIKDVEFEAKPGFWDIVYKIKEDKKYPMALASNSERPYATEVLKKLGIENIFDFMIFGDEVKNKKPNPEMFHKVAKFFNIKPNELLVFEDSLSGTTAATDFGARLIIIWDGQTPENLFPKTALFRTTDFEGISQTMDTTAEEEIEILRRNLQITQDQQTQKQLRS